mgnify:FL=1
MVVFAMAIFFSCTKTDDVLRHSAAEAEQRFFDSHRSNDPTEKSLVEYIRRQNEKYGFVPKTISQIGYPRWNKAITIQQKNSSPTSRGENSDTAVYYIPFVRDSQNYVNASMVIKVATSDTSFSYLCDWQYSQLQNNDTSVSDAAEHYGVFFMRLDKAVFGHNKFNILNSNLFSTAHGPAEYVKLDSIVSPNVNSLIEQVQLCQNVLIYFNDCTTPDDPACIPNCDRCWLCTSSFNYEYCWMEYVETGGGGSGGTGGGGGPGSGGTGGGSGGGGTPPEPCDGPQGLLAGRGDLPCDDEPGWEPLPIGDNPPATPCESLKSLFNQPALNTTSIITDSLKTFIQTHPSGEAGAAFRIAPDGSASFNMLPPTTTLELSIPAGGNVYSAIHSHSNNGYPMFSWSDVFSLYLMWARRPAHVNFRPSFLLTCKDDNGVYQTYAIIIEDIGTTLGDYFTNPENVGCTQDEIVTKNNDKLFKEYSYEENNNSNYELAFLRSIFGLNVSLYKANTNLTNWSKLSISNNSSNATVNSTNCN